MNGTSLSTHFTSVGRVLITLMISLVGFASESFGQADASGALAALARPGSPLPESRVTELCKAAHENDNVAASRCVLQHYGAAITNPIEQQCSTAFSSYETASTNYEKSCSKLGGSKTGRAGTAGADKAACYKRAEKCQDAQASMSITADDSDASCEDLVDSDCPELAALSRDDLKDENRDLLSERDSKNEEFESLQEKLSEAQKAQLEGQQAVQNLLSETRAKQKEAVQNLADQAVALGNSKVQTIQGLRAKYLEFDERLNKLKSDFEAGKAALLKRTNDVYRQCEAQVVKEREALEKEKKEKLKGKAKNVGSITRLSSSKQRNSNNRTKNDQAAYTKCLRSVASRAAFAEIEKEQQNLVSNVTRQAEQMDKERAVIIANLAEQERLAEAALKRNEERTQAGIAALETQYQEQRKQAEQSMALQSMDLFKLQSRMMVAEREFQMADAEFKLNKRQLSCVRSVPRRSGGTDINDDVADLMSSYSAKNLACQNMRSLKCPARLGVCGPDPAGSAAPVVPAPAAPGNTSSQ